MILTKTGEEKVKKYIQDCQERRNKILEAGEDTADEISCPDIWDIVADMNHFGLDSDNEYVNSWGITDNKDNVPICLKLGEDIELEPGETAYNLFEKEE